MLSYGQINAHTYKSFLIMQNKHACGKQTGKFAVFGYKTSGSTEQLLHLLLGGPGSGKTWITQIFTEVLDYFELKVKKYAFTGIAATLMQHAVTFNSGLFIPVPKKGESTNQKIAPLCSVTNTTACSFVQVEYEDILYCLG